MIKELRKEIYRIGKTATGVTAANLFYDQANPGVVGPYTIIRLLTDTHFFDSASKFDLFYFTLSSWGNTAIKAETQDAALITIFDFSGSSFSVTGHDTVYCLRVSTLPTRLREELWNVITTYRVELQKAR